MNSLYKISSRFSRWLLCSFLLLSVVVYAQKEDKSKLSQNKQKLQKEIEQTNKLLEQTKKNKQASLNKLIILNNQIQKREALINNTTQEIQSVESNIQVNTKKIFRLAVELDSLKKAYADMLRFAYKTKNSYDRLMFLFASKDFNQAMRRLKYMQQFTEQMRMQGEKIVKKSNQLNNAVQQLQGVKVEKVQLVKEQETEKQKLAREKTEQNSTLKELQKKEKKLRETLKQKEQAAKQLQKAIENIIAKEIAEAAKKKAAKDAAASAASKTTTDAAKTTTGKTGTTTPAKSTTVTIDLTPEEQLLSNSFGANKLRLPWPTEKGTIISSFGEHEHPVLKGIKTKNNGVDIATVAGASARAVFEGKVSAVISIPGSGKAVIVRHGEYLTVYSNLATVYVSMGDVVKIKQSIGLILTDQADNRTELHFELWKGKLLLNPASWLSARK